MNELYKIYLTECWEQKYFLLASELVMETAYIWIVEEQSKKEIYFPWHQVRAIVRCEK